MKRVLDFIVYAEGLKRELRHSWLSNGRQESVADHSWRMALLAITLAPHTKLGLDMEKVLKMTVIHDLAEIETGDIPTIHQTESVIAQKSKDEDRSFEHMKSRLGNYVGDELYALWQEFEGQQTAEARFVKAIDKLECVIQKNQQSVDSGRGASGYFEKLAGLCASDAMLSDFYAQVVDQVRRTGRDID